MPSSAPGRERRREDDAVAHDEDVLAGALGHEPVRGEHDRLVVAALERLDLRQRRVHVVAGRLRRRRHRVVIVAGPGRDLHPDPLLHRVVAQVGAPGPAGNRHVHRARERVQPHLAVAVVRDRPDVARRQPGRCDGVLRGLDELLHRVGDLHADDLGAAEEPLDVVGEPEHRRTLRSLVRTDPLEHPGAVVERVRQHVDAGVLPVDEIAVHPDLGRGRDGHGRSLEVGRRALERYCAIPSRSTRGRSAPIVNPGGRR